MMPTQQFNNYANLINFTRASSGTALRPISYGAERLTNGNFAAGTANWTAINSTIAASSGVLTVTATGLNYGQATQNITTVVGATYKVTATVSRGTADLGWILYNGAIAITILATTPTELTGSFVATSTTTLISIQTNNLVNNATILCSGISVKQVIFDQAGDPLTLFNHPNNVPRIEYDANGNRLGLLIEEARTNLMPYSEDFSNAAWVKAQATVSVQLDGSYFLTDNVVSDVHQISLPASTTVVGAYSYSVDFKAESLSSVRLVSTGAGMSTQTTQFNLSLGQVVGGSGSVTDLGGGWYRCTQFFTTLSTGFVTTRIRLDKAGSDNYAGSGESISLRRVQFELGAFPTSYIPTTGAAATRAADIASIPTSAFGYNATAGTVVCEFDTQYAPSTFRRIWELGSTASGANRIVTFVNAAGSTVSAEVDSNNVTQAGFTLYTDPTPAVGKVALAFAENNFAASANGGTPQTDPTGTMTPSVPRTLIKLGGATTNSADNMSGHLKSLQYYPRPLSPAQIQELTR